MARRQLPAHLQVPWGIGQALVVFLGAWVVLTILVIIEVRLLAPYVPFINTFLEQLRAGQLQATFELDLANAVGGLLLVWYYLRQHGVGWRSVGWRGFSIFKALGYFAAVFLVFVIAINVVLALIAALDPSFNANQAQSNDFTGTNALNHPTIAIIALVIVPPILEETVFRGFMFPAFAKRFGTVWGAVLSSILFGLAHLQANVSVYTFLLGLLLCFMYTKLRSVFPGMALHMLNNYLAYIAITSAK